MLPLILASIRYLPSQDAKPVRPIFASIHKRDIDGLRHSLRYVKPDEIVDNAGYRPLHVATMVGFDKGVRLLLRHGANKNAVTSDYKFSAITIATISHRSEPLRTLLIAGARVNVVDSVGWTPLHHAADAGSSIICEDLLLAGAGVNAVNRDGATPLIRAAGSRAKTYRAIQILLAYGASRDASDGRGMKAIDWARAKGKVDLVRLLK